IVLHEFVTGGGWYAYSTEPPPRSLANEGGAMLSALATDFGAMPDVQVDVQGDVRFDWGELPGCDVHPIASADENRQCFTALASKADWTVVIAPEFHGLLAQQCRAVEHAGGRLLGPGSQVVDLAADKHAMAEHLLAQGLPAPRGLTLAA